MTIKRKKVSVIGAGFTGATTAFLLAQKELCRCCTSGHPTTGKSNKGKALDMLKRAQYKVLMLTLLEHLITRDTADSDVVVITAGT